MEGRSRRKECFALFHFLLRRRNCVNFLEMVQYFHRLHFSSILSFSHLISWEKGEAKAESLYQCLPMKAYYYNDAVVFYPTMAFSFWLDIFSYFSLSFSHLYACDGGGDVATLVKRIERKVSFIIPNSAWFQMENRRFCDIFLLLLFRWDLLLASFFNTYIRRIGEGEHKTRGGNWE